MNVGVVLICRPRRFLRARVMLDDKRLRSFAPYLDDDAVAAIDRQIAIVPAICAGDPIAGPIAALSQSERWHWIAAPASTIVQTGPVHTGLCDEPAERLDQLFESMVAISCA